MLEESRRRIDRRAAPRHDDHQPRAGGAGDHDRPQPPGHGHPQREGGATGGGHEPAAPETPRFGDDTASMVSEGSDSMNVDGIGQLDEETARRASEAGEDEIDKNGEDETNIEPNTKRQRIAPVHVAVPPPGEESTPLGRGQLARESASSSNIVDGERVEGERAEDRGWQDDRGPRRRRQREGRERGSQDGRAPKYLRNRNQ